MVVGRAAVGRSGAFRRLWFGRTAGAGRSGWKIPHRAPLRHPHPVLAVGMRVGHLCPEQSAPAPNNAAAKGECDITASAIAGLDKAPTKHSALIAWVSEIAALTQPDRVEWCDGSDEEWARLTAQMVAVGTLRPLNPDIRPNSFLAASW